MLTRPNILTLERVTISKSIFQPKRMFEWIAKSTDKVERNFSSKGYTFYLLYSTFICQYKGSDCGARHMTPNLSLSDVANTVKITLF